MNDIKLWWVCKWDHYYPEGELKNVVGTFYTLVAAQRFATELKSNAYSAGSNYSIVNVSKMLGIDTDIDDYIGYLPDLNWDDE